MIQDFLDISGSTVRVAHSFFVRETSAEIRMKFPRMSESPTVFSHRLIFDFADTSQYIFNVKSSYLCCLLYYNFFRLH